MTKSQEGVVELEWFNSISQHAPGRSVIKPGRGSIQSQTVILLTVNSNITIFYIKARLNMKKA